MTVFRKRHFQRLFLGLALALTTAFSGTLVAAPSEPAQEEIARAIAIQKIEYLRREYGRATDLIGLNTEEGIEKGRKIYHRIFTPDAKISTIDDGEVGFSAVGPDAWVKVVAKALSVFDHTQHMIGTQVVDLKSLPGADGKGGEASMTSYLQAWHDDPDRVLDIFIGTYHDKVRYSPEAGWQIEEMVLEKVSGEVTKK